MSELVDLKGQRIGRWRVIKLWGVRHSLSRDRFGNIIEKTRVMWLCECSCKLRTTRPVESSNLVQRSSKSCGCRRTESVRSPAVREKNRQAQLKRYDESGKGERIMSNKKVITPKELWTSEGAGKSASYKDAVSAASKNKIVILPKK